MLLGSDLAAALSSSSSRGSSRSPTETMPNPPQSMTTVGTDLSPLALVSRIRFRQTPQRNSLRQHRSSASILRPTNDCRHFHYETVELGPVLVELLESDLENGEGEDGGERKNEIDEQKAMKLRVESNGKEWTIRRTFMELCQLDCQLHRCIFSREHSKLEELAADEDKATLAKVRYYLQRLSMLTGSLMRCYSVLSFFELDNRGNHFNPAELSQMNVPAIACAVTIRPFAARRHDQLSLHIGDIVSVVEMEEGADWWRGKLTVPSGGGGEEDENCKQFGFFPSNCVRLFSDRLSLGEQIWLTSQPKPGGGLNRRKSVPFNKLLLSSPTPRLKSLLRLAIPTSPGNNNTVFGKDLATFEGKVPQLVKECIGVIERRGMLPVSHFNALAFLLAITQQVQSNIRRLRREFSHGRCPQWDSPMLAQMLRNDIHSVPSLLKQFFRQLPDPLLPFQLHSRFIAAFTDFDVNKHSTQSDELFMAKIHSFIGQLPLAHSKTANCLFHHLERISLHPQTEMSARNLAIVWAPNLLRCPPTQMTDWPNQLAGLDLHTDICEFIIRNAGELFDKEEIEEKEEKGTNGGAKMDYSMEKPKKEEKKLRQKRKSLIGHSAAGNEAIGFDQSEGTKMMSNEESNAIGSPKWRRFLQNTSHSLEHSFNTILRRPSAATPSTISSPQMSKRSQSVDRNKEKPTTRTAQRLLNPFGASVMRRVRSVRKSVQKFRPSSTTASTRPPSPLNPLNHLSTSNQATTIHFMHENIRPPSVHSSHSSHSMLDLSAAETVKEFEDNPPREGTAKRRVNFGEECDDGEDAGLDEEEDSMPLDISRYDNVQSSIHAREKAKTNQKTTSAQSNYSPKIVVAERTASRNAIKSGGRLKSFSLEIEGENIYF